MASGIGNDHSGHFINHGGQRLNGVKIEGDFNCFHSDADKGTIYKRCLRDLRATDPRIDKRRIEGSKDRLLPDLCSWVLRDKAFQDWWTYDNHHLLWIHGDPGKGKTMIMLALESEISRRTSTTAVGGVVSYFLCQSTDDRLNHAAAILRGLIFMLVAQDRETLLHPLRKKLDEAKDAEGSSNLVYSLSRILFDLSSKSKFANIYLMIDALDECRFELSPLLQEVARSESCCSKIKWLVTSRNEVFIKENLQSRNRPSLSLEVNSSHVENAVNAYIRAKVEILAESKRYGSELRGEVEEYISKKADGVFLWVALVCEELQKIPKLDTRGRLKRFPTGLGHLYEWILAQLPVYKSEDYPDRHLQILQLVTLALRPLNLSELVVLGDLLPGICHNLQDSRDLVETCGSFLTIQDDIVYWVHQSATDFFKDGDGKKIFCDGITHANKRIAFRCLDLMSCNLQQNICQLSTPDASPLTVDNEKLEQFIPHYLQYSIRYWVDHLQHSHSHDERQPDIGRRVLSFLQSFILKWLEALSLVQSTIGAVQMIINLQSMQLADETETLAHFVADIKRLSLYNRSIIENAPLQVYSSSIIFSPEQSILRRAFENGAASCISLWPRTLQGWSPCLSTLEGHSSEVTAVTFSPNGQLVASASKDSTVRLWDTQTGTLRNTFEGHSNFVTAVTFSPSGQFVASASEDNTVRLWDTQTGTLQNTFEGHSNFLTAVTFSPNGQLVASASWDKTVQLWDTQTGALRNTLRGHFEGITAVTFSPNGQLVASASKDSTTRLWDTQKGVLQDTLKGHSDWVSAVTFSPNGQLVASASHDNTVRLWDTQTGTLQNKFEGHSDWVSAVTFSPNGQLVASASYDSTVRLWDTQTGALRNTLRGHSHWVNAVTFSPNSQLVASASKDSTVRLWDTQTGALQNTFEGHSNFITAITFSPNGQIMASASADFTMRLWETQIGALQNTFEGHSSEVTAVTFSPNGQLVASASHDHTVRLWETQTGALQNTLEGHSGVVTAVTFSLDGNLIASASEDWTVRLWDMQTGAIRNTFEDQDFIHQLSFGSDGSYLIADTRRINLSIPVNAPPSLDRSSASDYSISQDRCWIMWRGFKVLWLPPEYRPVCKAISGRTVVIGRDSGGVTFIRFKECTNILQFC